MQGPHAMCGACVGSASSRPERCWQDAAALQRWTYRRRMQRGAQRAPWCLVRRELVASRAEFARARSEARVHAWHARERAPARGTGRRPARDAAPLRSRRARASCAAQGPARLSIDDAGA